MRPDLILAEYEYPPLGVPAAMVAALLALACLVAWKTAPPGGEARLWESPIVRVFAVFGVVVVVFMAWAAATG
jgi:hypothetical protein